MFGILFALLSATAFSISNIMIKKGNQRSSGGDTGFFLTVITNVVVLGTIFFISLVNNGFSFSWNWNALLFFILAGVLTTGIGRLSLFSSIRKIGAIRAPAIKNGAPIFSVLFALFLLGESVTVISILGMTLLLIAIVLQGFSMMKRVRKKNTNEIAATIENLEERRIQMSGYLLAILAALCFGLGQGVRKQGLLFLNDAFFGAFIGAVTSLVFFAFYDGFRGKLMETVKRNFTVFNPFFLASGVLTSLGPLFFFLAALHIEVAYVSVLAGVEPLITTILSAFFLRGEENLNFTVWVSVVLVLFGTTLIAVGG